jgi:CBS domain-containing protein
MRLGLLSACDPQVLSDSLKPLFAGQAEKIMSQPATCIGEDQLATDAVNLMIEKNLKRFPVINNRALSPEYCRGLTYFARSCVNLRIGRPLNAVRSK